MIYILIICAIVIGEHYVKHYIEENKSSHKEEKIVGGKIILTKYHNKGAALNFMEKNSKLLIGITGVMIGIVLVCFFRLLGRKNCTLYKLGLSMILGGALSNFCDRLEHGYVIDYFRFDVGKKFKRVIFNLADFFIFIGSAIVCIASIFKKK